MNLGQLLSSTNTFGRNRASVDAMMKKEFGDIFVDNKETKYNSKLNEVEISMYFGAKTQENINMHRATIALKDVKQDVLSRWGVAELLKESFDPEFLLDKLQDYYGELWINDRDKYSDITNKINESRKKFEAPFLLPMGEYTRYNIVNSNVISQHEYGTYDKYQNRIEEATFIDGITPEQKRHYDQMLKYHAIMIKEVMKNGGSASDVIKHPKYKEWLEAMTQYEDKYLLGKKTYRLTGGKTLLKDEYFRKTDEYKKRKEELLNNIPDDAFVELILSDPYIIPTKIIVPKSKSAQEFILMAKKIPLDTEVRVNCSCFTGDTRVQLANGMSLSLKDLENMTDFKVLAYNTETGKYEYARALNCTKRQENARIMKITLADGTSIRVTPSHRFLNNNCEWKQAQELQVGDLLKFNDKYWGYENHEQKTSSSTFIYLDPTQEGDYQFGELKFTHRPFYVGITTGAFVNIENEKCIDYLNKLAGMNEQPLMFKQYYHVDEHVALQLKEKLVNRIGTIEQGSLLVNNLVQVNDNFINENDDYIAITEIEELQEREDVYCLTVEGLGNFAIQTNKGNIIVENCADYYWTFAWANFMHKVHKGQKPPPYMNTYKRHYAIRNPYNYAGCCKHLIVFISILMQEGFLNARTTGKENRQSSMVRAYNSMKKREGITVYDNKQDLRSYITEMDNALKEFRARAKEVGQETRETIKDVEAGEYFKPYDGEMIDDLQKEDSNNLVYKDYIDYKFGTDKVKTGHKAGRSNSKNNNRYRYTKNTWYDGWFKAVLKNPAQILRDKHKGINKF